MPRHILITGGNSGIGAAAAVRLAAAGHRVTIVGRDAAKGNAVVSTHPELISFVRADLSTVAGMHAFCDAFQEKHAVIDSLVLGAGVVNSSSAARTVDDVHVNFATNYLHRFVVAERLLPLLEKSHDPRIVFLCAGVPLTSQIDFDRFPRLRDYSTLRDRTVTQIANYLYAQRLAEHHGAVSVGVASAGITYTDIFREMPIAAFVFWILTLFIGVSVDTAADNVVFAAADRPAWAATRAALYWPSPGRTAEAQEFHLDKAIADRVFAVTKALVDELQSQNTQQR